MTDTGLTDLLALPDTHAAFALDCLIRSLDAAYKRGFAAQGIILAAMEQRRLWAYLTDPATSQLYTSMDRWILTAAPWSYRQCYSAKEAIKRLLPEIPAEQLADIPRGNILVMGSLSPQVRKDAGVLEAARTMREDAFTAKIEAEHPGQHIEQRCSMSFRPTRSQADAIQEAITKAIMIGSCTTREEVLEMWAAEWTVEHAEEIASAIPV